MSSIIRSHGARRDEAIWSAGLRGRAVKAHSPECPPDLPKIGALVMDFSNNDMGDEAASAIAESLKNDTWLLGLNLGGNKVTDKGAEDIGKAVAVNTTLRALVLAGNDDISDGVEKVVKEGITVVAESEAPPAAGEEIVVRAMRLWQKWRNGKASGGGEEGGNGKASGRGRAGTPRRGSPRKEMKVGWGEEVSWREERRQRA